MKTLYEYIFDIFRIKKGFSVINWESKKYVKKDLVSTNLWKALIKFAIVKFLK